MSLNTTIVQHVVRLFAIVLLSLWSLGISAQVSVVTQSFTGGTVVEKSQSEPADDGSVIVTLTVTPESGYCIAKSDIKVMATLPVEVMTRTGETNAIRIGDPLTLEGDDPVNLSDARDYQVKVGMPFGIYVLEANFHKTTGFVNGGTYRIGFVSGNQHWYLWPSVTTDAVGNPYLTTFNGMSAPALDYSVKGVKYDAFGEQYSQWMVTSVEQDGKTFYRLKNVALQQYVVWSDVQGLMVVHLEESPADYSHTLFRFDGEFPNVLITPAGAAEGTTLNSKAGDKPFLSASGDANAAAGYPDGEPNADGSRGLIQLYDGTPVWTLEEAGKVVTVQFDKISEEGSEQAAVLVPQEDYALPDGMHAYFVTDIDLASGIVILSMVDYIPAGVPTLLMTEEIASEFVFCNKTPDTPTISSEVIAANLLRVGSPEVQPTLYEDYVFMDGMFIMMGGGTLPTGMFFLDLSQEQFAQTRGMLSIGGDSGTTGINDIERDESRVEGWFTLDGRRLNFAPIRKGIYIHNGKKIIVK